MVSNGWHRLLVLAVLMLSSCRAPDAATSCAASFSAVASAAQHLVDRDNARDLAGVLAGYTDDVVWLPPNGDVLAGKPAIQPRYEQLFSGFTIALTSEVVEARADGALGFARGFTRGRLTSVRDGAVTVVNDKFLALARCEGGTWRISHLMWSPSSPGS